MTPIKLTVTVTIRPTVFSAEAIQHDTQRYLDSAAMVAAKRIWEWFETENVLSIEATADHGHHQGKARVQG